MTTTDTTSTTLPFELDGLCIVGKVVGVRDLKTKDGSRVWGREVTIKTDNGPIKIITTEDTRTLVGRIELPAWHVLTTHVIGQRMAISVGITTDGPYINYTAVNAYSL